MSAKTPDKEDLASVFGDYSERVWSVLSKDSGALNRYDLADKQILDRLIAHYYGFSYEQLQLEVLDDNWLRSYELYRQMPQKQYRGLAGRLQTLANSDLSPIAKAFAWCKENLPELKTRRQLLKIMGYTQSELKEYDINQLRQMTADGGFIPISSEAVSHAEIVVMSYLAMPAYHRDSVLYRAQILRYSNMFGSNHWAANMRSPLYLARQIVEKLKLPFPAILFLADTKLLLDMCNVLGLDMYIQEDVGLKYQTRMEHYLLGPSHKVLNQLGPHKFRSVHADEKKHYQEREQVAGAYLGVYYPHNGSIYFNPKIARDLVRIFRDKSIQTQKDYRAFRVWLHELHHAASYSATISTRYPSTTSIEHTFEEGTVEILSQMSIDKMARSLGFVQSKDKLDDLFDGGSYGAEVIAMLIIADICTRPITNPEAAGKFVDYNNPRRAGKTRTKWLKRFHLLGMKEREQVIINALVDNYNLSPTHATELMVELGLFTKNMPYVTELSRKGKLTHRQRQEIWSKMIAFFLDQIGYQPRR